MNMLMIPFPERCDIETYYQSDEIYDYIGQGTFATVFKAICVRDVEKAKKDQEVALKVFDKKSLCFEKNLRDVINEVEILRHVNHDHCVKLLDYFQTPFHVVIVMNYVDGKELFHAIKEHEFTEEMVCIIVHQLLEALHYLHETLHIVHRDIKPENILVNEVRKGSELSVTLVDFGLARKFSRQTRLNRKRVLCDGGLYCPQIRSCETEEKLQQKEAEREHSMKLRQGQMETNTITLPLRSLSTDSFETDSPLLTTPCGTYRYAAPETIDSVSRNGQLYTTRGLISRLDIYACGVIMYVMISGTLPFRDGNNKTALIREMEAGPVFTNLRWANISPEAIELNKSLLVSDAKLRPSAKEALHHRWFSLLNNKKMDYLEVKREGPFSREKYHEHGPSENNDEQKEIKELEIPYKECSSKKEEKKNEEESEEEEKKELFLLGKKK